MVATQHVRTAGIVLTAISATLLIIGTGGYYWFQSHGLSSTFHSGLFTFCSDELGCNDINTSDCSIANSGGVELSNCGNLNAARGAMVIACIAAIQAVIFALLNLAFKMRAFLMGELAMVLFSFTFGFMGCSAAEDYIYRFDSESYGNVGVGWSWKIATAGWFFGMLAAVKVLVHVVATANFKNPHNAPTSVSKL